MPPAPNPLAFATTKQHLFDVNSCVFQLALGVKFCHLHKEIHPVDTAAKATEEDASLQTITSNFNPLAERAKVTTVTTKPCTHQCPQSKQNMKTFKNGQSLNSE